MKFGHGLIPIGLLVIGLTLSPAVNHTKDATSRDVLRVLGPEVYVLVGNKLYVTFEGIVLGREIQGGTKKPESVKYSSCRLFDTEKYGTLKIYIATEPSEELRIRTHNIVNLKNEPGIVAKIMNSPECKK